MSAGGAFGGNRGARPMPLEKGVFPLDHMHLCDQEKKEYISCLKTSGHKSDICRHLSKLYLQCRMENSICAHIHTAWLRQIQYPKRSVPLRYYSQSCIRDSRHYRCFRTSSSSNGFHK